MQLTALLFSMLSMSVFTESRESWRLKLSLLRRVANSISRCTVDSTDCGVSDCCSSAGESENIKV